MGKTAKLFIKHRGDKLPQNIGGILANADEQDLKILVTLMMAADGEGEIPEDISVSDILGIDAAAVDASLKFWRGAGIISGKRASKASKPSEPAAEAKKSSIPSAHANGVVESSAELGNYRSGELVELLERRRVTAEFIDEAQRVFGKTFNSYDTSKVVGLIDQLCLDEEAVLAILAYTSSLGKGSLRYAEKLAINLYDEGFRDTEEIVTRIKELERSRDLIFKVQKLFGFGNRSLTTTEKKLFEKWTLNFGYGIDVIRHAYDITVDRTHEAAPKYTNAILERWHSLGLKTLGDVQSFEKEQSKEREKVSAKEGDKSYDLDDFFDAAIKRSFEDLK